MRFWSRFLYAGQKTFSTSSRGWWGGVVEIGLATLLIFSGFLFLIAALAIQYFYSNTASQHWHYSLTNFILRVSLASLALLIGIYRMLIALWKVSVTVERREAIAAVAGDFDFFGDSSPASLKHPNLPRLAQLPTRGSRLQYRLFGHRRRFRWLLFTSLATLVAIGIATVLLARILRSSEGQLVDYGAISVAIIATVVAIWGAIAFIRQAMRLAAFGPTSIEISQFPLRPNENFQVLLFQPGRFRFKLLEVFLVCEEVATFTRGTDIQTERRSVVEERLVRLRGVNVTPQEPFETEFEFRLPPQAMHSFASTDNQIQWKIVVQTTAKGWPRVEQVFPILVLPPIACGPRPLPATRSESKSND